MSSETRDDTMSLLTEEMKERFSEEVRKALEVYLPGIMERVQTSMMEMMEEKMNELKGILVREKDQAKERKACPYNKFMACNPPIYNGEADPIACQRWVSDIEGVFERTQCDPTDFVAYGTGQLRAQAKDWWDNLKLEKGIEATRVLTWDEFKVYFLKHHSPKAMVNKIKEEFTQLRQKGETIDKITGIFLDKLKFCGELAQTEEQKIYYYYNMLSSEYREFITPSHYEYLTDIINAAREHEIDIRKQVERGERRVNDTNPSPSKKPKVAEPPKKGNAKGGSSTCKVCGKAHWGECKFKDRPCTMCGQTGHWISNCPVKMSACYNCYQPGHKKTECPELTRAKTEIDKRLEIPISRARSFQITAAKVKMEPDVVTGNTSGQASGASADFAGKRPVT